MNTITYWQPFDDDKNAIADFPSWIQDLPFLEYDSKLDIWKFINDEVVLPISKNRVYVQFPGGDIAVFDEQAWGTLHTYLLDHTDAVLQPS